MKVGKTKQQTKSNLSTATGWRNGEAYLLCCKLIQLYCSDLRCCADDVLQRKIGGVKAGQTVSKDLVSFQFT
jgi:hypothetical protein